MPQDDLVDVVAACSEGGRCEAGQIRGEEVGASERTGGSVQVGGWN